MDRMARGRNIRDGARQLGTDEARQAARTGYMWRVLALSVLFGALVVLGAWMWNAAANRPVPPGQRGQVHVVAQPNAPPPPASAPRDQVVRPSPNGHDTGA